MTDHPNPETVTNCSVQGCPKAATRRGWCQPHYFRWWRHGDPLAGRSAKGKPMALIRQAVRSQTDDCILWPYATGGGGYGRLRYRGHMRPAHAVACELAHGPAPDGAEAAHLPVVCHNPACINPRHVRWASPKENAADRTLDGTHQRGVRNNAAKLTTRQALEIRNDPRPQRSIAADYGVSKATVGHIKTGLRWGWAQEDAQ